jgi:hypothetical protein
VGLLDSVRKKLFPLSESDAGTLEPARVLDISSGTNFRDLGGYDSPWGPTRYRRFVRSGSTSYLTERDLARLQDYGVCRVLDLRSPFESPRTSDRFSRREGVEWLNVALFDYDLSDPQLSGTATPSGNYLIAGYVNMLSYKSAIRRIFEYFAQTPEGGCALFHCAAGMDRTGMTAMLLLGLAEVPREQVVADYLYSFAPVREVDRVVFQGEEPYVRQATWNPFPSRQEAIEFMLDRVAEGYGDTWSYLRSCGIEEDALLKVRRMLVPMD